jgi:hypothetical protein
MNALPHWPSFIGFYAVACLAGMVTAQVVPTTPTKFGKRSTGGMTTGSSSIDPGVSNSPSAKPIIKQVSYIALSDSRQWTSNDGKALVGKLIAWEQHEEVLASAAEAGKMDQIKLPTRPTVLRDQSVRLLINQKPFEVPLDRLSQADRDFINERAVAIAKSAEKAANTTK